MSIWQTLPAAALVGVAMTLGWNAVLDWLTPAPPIIEVHTLEYRDGVVIQDSTVTPPGSEQVHLMLRAGQVVYAGTGRAVSGCTGSGLWPYERGRLRVEFDLPYWVGREHCTPDALPVGVDLKLRAVWFGGDHQVVAESRVFRAGDDG